MNSTTQAVSIRHDEAGQRFVAEFEGKATGAELRYRKVDAHTLDYYSTFTPPEMRGRGIAGVIVRFALDYALEQDMGVVPTCPFVARLIGEVPEYRKLRR